MHQKIQTHENARKKNTKSQLKIANLVNSIKDSEKPKKKYFSKLCLTHVATEDAGLYLRRQQQQEAAPLKLVLV